MPSTRWTTLPLALVWLGCTSPRAGSEGPADAAVGGEPPSITGPADGAPSTADAPVTGPTGVVPGNPGGGDGPAPPTPDTGPMPPPPDLMCPAGQKPCASSPRAVCVDTETSPQHCGACGRDCAGGACLFGVCQPSIVASGLTGGMFMRGGASTDGEDIFVADWNSNDIKAVHLENGYVRQPARTSARPYNVTLLGPHVYWSQLEGSAIRFYRVPKQGLLAMYEMIAALDEPGSTVVPNSLQMQGGYLYWVRRKDSRVVVERTIPASGTINQVMAMADTALRDDVVVHASGIYWTDGGMAPNQIWRTPLGGGAPTSFETGGNTIHHLVGTDDQHLYWISNIVPFRDVHAVFRKLVDGSAPAVSLGTSPFPLGHPLAVFDRDTLFLFGTDQAGVVAFPLTGGGRQVEIAGPAPNWNPAGAAVTDCFVYWVSQAGVFWRVIRR